MKYQKILVAIDRSAEAEMVFEQAMELAKREKASLMVFHCLPIEAQGTGYYGDMFGRELVDFSNLIQDKLKKETEDAQKWLSHFCQKATAEGVATEWTCKVGDAGSAIRELAQSWGADLVVLGRRGRRGFAEMLLGSVSNHVVHHVPCSVLVVQGISAETQHDHDTRTTAQINESQS
ncbi:MULTISPECIES: universal stress protein [unclassified Coleofasciculus]|uniref:universal stress protein n=1 Tax=unclassified Coleofasciculus TaxID=2692782 RepID=UPI001882A569|nr:MULTISPECIES: universal stress protein [unclassified Coleofasciculus]MBE9129360.1 universal stress protein [Coleofasciculus sp. LEGE 07081]MBE9152003.1 universal stress protein [Coleofasciculus sp. LEGE 07092]